MKTKQDKFLKTMSHAEVLNFAIMYLGNKCVEGVEKLRWCNDEEMKKSIRFLYAPWFFKTKKLCELYELETGSEYQLSATFGIEVSDLDME